MQTKIIDITNQDGSSTKITHFFPTAPSENNLPVMVIFPAMGVRGTFYKTLAIEFSTKGYDVITTDLRGIGNSSLRPNKSVDFGYNEMMHYDYESIIKSVREMFIGKKIFLLGHSLGGQLSSLYAAKNPDKVDGLILIACCSVYYKGWGSKQYFALLGTQFTRVVTKLLGYFPGKKLGFGGTEAKTVMRDWSEQSRTGKYIVKNDSFDYESGLAKLVKPLLVISFQQDNFAPQKAVMHLLDKFKSNTNRQYEYLKTDDNRNDNFSHFNWAKKPRSIVEIINEWYSAM